jgi:uncharacterized protein DUF6152
VRIGVLVLLVGCVLPVAAHHSFAAEFDDKQPVKLDGTVVKFDFMNPHSWIYLDEESGWRNGAMVGGNRQHKCPVSPRMAEGIAAARRSHHHRGFPSQGRIEHGKCQFCETTGWTTGQCGILTR